MKKKLLTILPVLLLSLSGCNTTATQPHTHAYDLENISWYWQETSTGYKASATFTCPTCDEEQEGHEVTVDASVTSRVEKNPTCQEDGTLRYTAKVSFQEQEFTSYRDKTIHDETAHHFIQVADEQYLATPATCEENATYYYSCEYCHKKSEETFEKENSKISHQLSHIPEKEATCSEPGNIEYWVCDVCHQYFSDNQGTNKINEQDVIIPKNNNHTLTHHEATTSTCSVHGNIEYWTCDVCHKYFSNEEGTTEISASETELPLSHNMTYHQGSPATCESDGQKDYYTCSYEPGVLYKDEAGTEKYNDESELIIPQLVHEYDENLNCIHCQKSLMETYELESAGYLDSVPSITASDLGLQSETLITPEEGQSDKQVYTRYNFNNVKAIDLWLEYEYELKNTDSYFLIYLFNQYDESGATLRLQNNRTEDDGIVSTYIYTMNAYGDATTFVQGPGNPGTYFYFPRITGVKSSTQNVIHITADCINEANNTYEISYTLGVKGGTLCYPSTNPEAKNNQKLTFIIELGENYFNNGLHNLIRFSSIKDAKVTIKDMEAQVSTPSVTYLNANNIAVGKKNSTALELPAIKVENKTLVGWFDLEGNKVNAGQEITSKLVIAPLLTDTKENMLSLTNLGFEPLIEISQSSQETQSPNDYSLSSGNRIDLYFIYQFVERTNTDNYFICGMNYDFVDAETRIMIRIDNGVNDHRICGFIYGKVLGGDAGAAGTRFESPDGLRPNEKTPLLVHITLIDNGDNSASFTLEFTNLATKATYSTSREASYSIDWNLTSTYSARNRFGYTRPINCAATLSNVF